MCFYVHIYKSEVGLSVSKYFPGRIEISIEVLELLCKTLNMELFQAAKLTCLLP